MDHKPTMPTIKLLGSNIGKDLGDLGFGNDFLDIRPKAQFMKLKLISLPSLK